MRVKRAEKYGFCSGVRIADLKVKRFASGGGRGAILGQVVHNERVVEEMENLGVRTVDEITAVDEPTIVFSAHGVPPSFHDAAKGRGLNVLDTTCKFVYDIHHESKDALAGGFHLIFIGDPKHREVIGYTHDLDPASYHIVLTTDDVDAIDWTHYDKIKVFYQTTLNSEDFEHVVKRIEERAKRTARRAQLEEVREAVDVVALWYRDLMATSLGAEGAVINSDAAGELAKDAKLGSPADAARAVAIVSEARRSLELNVQPALAVEAMFHRLRQASAGR